MNFRYRSIFLPPARFRIFTIMSHILTTNVVQQAAASTAGIIVIGDEILKGHVQDSNSHFLSKRLFSLGVQVKKISVIPDDLETIATEVSDFSQKFTYVITSGGIGPTHDDITFEGVAKAFNEKIHAHPDLVKVCKEYFGTDDLSSPKLKMAHIPESSVLHYGVNKKTGQKRSYPLVNVRNVYVFPGVPHLMESAFKMLEDLFRNPDREFHVKELYITRNEVSIASALNKVNEQFKDRIILGSYPDFHNSYYRVKLTVESQSAQDVDDACQAIEHHLPPGEQHLPSDSLVDYDREAVRNAPVTVFKMADNNYSDGTSEQLHSHVRRALDVIDKCLEQYEMDEICIGFNGGKDCTALLHLTHAAIKKKYPQRDIKLKALYIRRGRPFPEVELFIKKSQQRYNLEMITIEGRIKDALAELKQQHPKVKAVIMGTRNTDPYSSHLESFSPTDSDWPQYMRVNPILDWCYTDVWSFLRSLSVPYCQLYDNGYTSLGSMENTHPNPHLQETDDKGIVTYRPAYMLSRSDSERSGRN